MFNISNTPIGNTGAFYELTDVPQATTNATDTTRDGDQVYIRSLDIRGWVVVNATAGYNLLRVLVVQATSFLTGPPINSNILLTPVTYGLLSPYNHDNRFNFKILYDKVFAVDITWRNKVPFRFRLNKKFKQRKIQYSAGAANAGTNRLFLMFISDNGVDPPRVDFASKFNFGDS